MKAQHVIALAVLLLFVFFVWNRTQNETFTDVSSSISVEPSTIQSIVNNIQARVPDLYPVQTVYINPLQGDQGNTVYNARILFLNTRGYFGVQYDVQADEQGNLIKVTGLTQSDAGGPFLEYQKDDYQTFDSVEEALQKQFDDLKSRSPDMAEKLNTWLDKQRAQQMGTQYLAAQSNSLPAGSSDAYLENALVA